MRTRVARNGIALLLALFLAPMALAEEVNLKAVVSWDGHGQLFQIGVEEQEFLGSLNGVIYVETSEGALNEGFIECTARHRLHRGESRDALTGHCTVVQSAEDSVFAEYECSGEVGACTGSFKITGGTGEFEGINGSSPLIMRSPLRHISLGMTRSEELVVRHGVMIMTDLTYRLAGGEK